jgi:hypothetical protein
MYRQLLLCVFLTLAARARANTIATFEDLGLTPEHFLDDAGASGLFVSGGMSFYNSFDPTFQSWAGFAISSTTDTTTPGFTNQFSAITGSGANGSATYAVAFTFGPDADPFHPAGSVVDLAPGTLPASIDVTNSTYAYLSMLDGDSFAHKFEPGDFFLLDITGYSGLDGTGQAVGTVDFYLANFLDGSHSIVNTWQTLDLTSLAGAASLRFGLQSSDNNPNFGMNTPAYVAIDDLQAVSITAVPEASTLALSVVGLVGLAAFRRVWRGVSVAMVVLILAGTAPAARADFDPQVGQPGSLAIPTTSPLFLEWASSVVSLTRGPQDIADPNSPLASFGVPSNVLGPADASSGKVVSLGDGGSITLGFATPIANGPGADFAVFENGFLSGPAGMAYLELAFVDVSSDGIHFYRFPSVSLTQTMTQVGGFGMLDARNLHDLAGKYIAGYGTGFDLSELVGVSPLLDVNRVTEVRIIDVVGSIDPRYGTHDSLGNLINDPFPTPFASSGFDLNGVGVINMAAAVPEPTSLALLGMGAAAWFGIRRGGSSTGSLCRRVGPSGAGRALRRSPGGSGGGLTPAD